MKIVFFSCSMALVILATLGGCASSKDYCCTSNDQCFTTSEGPHSCSNDECGKCLLVSPLAITPQTLTDAAVLQTDYRIELTASGGITPYTWMITKGDETKLSWLTISQEGDDKAILQNLISANNIPLYPQVTGGEISLTINVLDSSKHGKADREDNQGKQFQFSINIKDCVDQCNLSDPTTCIDDPTKVRVCVLNTTYNCNRLSEVSCPTGQPCHDSKCGGCTGCWDDQNSKCVLTADQNASVCGLGGVNCNPCDTNQHCIDGVCTSCDGCWSYWSDVAGICLSMKDGSQSKNQCGTGGEDCSSCRDVPNSKCLATGCTDGQCVYRYKIQTTNGVEEVLDTQQMLVWKREYEPAMYTWFEATANNVNNQSIVCGPTYRLPTKDELATIIEHGPTPSNNECAFPRYPSPYEPDCTVSPSIPLPWFWSSTECEFGDGTRAYAAAFTQAGVMTNGAKTEDHYVRCMRLGP